MLNRLFHWLVPLSLAAGACAGGPTYARRDYAQYPDYKQEIALLNVQDILKDVCKKSHADQSGFSCSFDYCTAYQMVNNLYEVCRTSEPRDLRYSWSSLREVPLRAEDTPDGHHCVHLGLSECAIRAKNSRQAAELVEAMQKYLEGN